MVGDDLTQIWWQDICNHRDDVSRLVRFSIIDCLGDVMTYA